MIDNEIANLAGASTINSVPASTAIREKYTPTTGPIKKPIENAAPIID